jgi:alcohol dehydrogenase class IV
MTPIQGITADGVKKTVRDLRMLPKTVIYDPTLLLTLPARIAGPSGINGIAHAVEALYAQDTNPITSIMAEESIRALAHSLPTVVREPQNLEARAEALYGAWLAGLCLGTVGMALHHKLCHTLGGSFNLPHAETHTIVLPHATRYNAPAAPQAMQRIARALGVQDAASGLYDLAVAVDAPLSLEAIGMPKEGIDRAADLAVTNPYWNPQPLERGAIRALLQAAWEGRRP